MAPIFSSHAGIALPSTLMFDFPSVKLLSEYIDTSRWTDSRSAEWRRGMREAHEKSQGSLTDAPASQGQVVKRTRMVKKFRPKPRQARPARQIQFNQEAEPRACNLLAFRGDDRDMAPGRLLRHLEATNLLFIYSFSVHFHQI